MTLLGFSKCHKKTKRSVPNEWGGIRAKVARAAAEEDATLRSLDIFAIEDHHDDDDDYAVATSYATYCR